MKIPRKLDVLIKFYKQTIANDKVSFRTRMSAAARLDDLYARHALMYEKAEMRKERAELRATAQRTQEGGIPAQESPLEMNETETMDAVFGSILNGERDKADDHAD